MTAIVDTSRFQLAVNWFFAYVDQPLLKDAIIAGGWTPYEMCLTLADEAYCKEPHNHFLRGELTSPQFCDWLADVLQVPRVTAVVPSKVRKARSESLTKEQMDKICELYDLGVPQKEIAEKFTRSLTTINKIVRFHREGKVKW